MSEGVCGWSGKLLASFNASKLVFVIGLTLITYLYPNVW